jgi:hypothetical protein
MEAASAIESLHILTYGEFLRLKRDLKATGIDLCYTARISRPVRVPWSTFLLQDPILLNHIERHLPTEPIYRMASVRMTKQGGWFGLDEYSIAFHAASSTRDAELEQYLSDHNIHTRAEISRDLVEGR